MNLEELELVLAKLEALKKHVENYFESEEQHPGIYWATLFPINHAIDHAITVMDGHVQLQQIQEKQAS